MASLGQTWRNNNGAAGATNLTVTVSGATPGVKLFCNCTIRFGGTGVQTPVTGWDLVNDATAGTGQACRQFERVADGTAADNFSITYSTGKAMSAVVVEVLGADPAAPPNVVSFPDGSNNDSGWFNDRSVADTGGVTPVGPTVSGISIAILSTRDRDDWTNTLDDDATNDIFITQGYTDLRFAYGGAGEGNSPLAGLSALQYSDLSPIPNAQWTHTGGTQNNNPSCCVVFCYSDSGAPPVTGTNIKIGEEDITEIYIGDVPITACYLGSEKIFGP